MVTGNPASPRPAKTNGVPEKSLPRTDAKGEGKTLPPIHLQTPGDCIHEQRPRQQHQPNSPPSFICTLPHDHPLTFVYFPPTPSIFIFFFTCSPPVTASMSSDPASSTSPNGWSGLTPFFFFPPKLKTVTPAVMAMT